MKYNRILLIFCLATPVAIALRIVQLLFTVETVTGFFIQKYQTLGTVLLALVIFLALGIAVLGRYTYRNPEIPPMSNAFTGIGSLLFAGAILYEALSKSTPIIATDWQITLLKIFSLLTAVYLISFALSPFFNYKIPSILHTLPTVYMIIKLICDFSTISKLALISDNVMVIFSYCFVMLFFLNFAKLYAYLDEYRNAKKLLSFGLASVLLCLSTAIPNIVLNIISQNGYLHTPFATNLTLLTAGIFIISFIDNHFSIKNFM